MTWEIPFNRPYLTGNEESYVARAIAQRHGATDGPFSQACSELIERRFDVGRCLLTTSCTAGLEMAAMLCDFQEGDEVILPSFTFVATACAFVRAGARPVFVDIRPDTFNLDEKRVAEAVTDRTRAIVPVHYAGIGCEMEAIEEIARRAGAIVVEDAAQGVNAKRNGRHLGAVGHLAAYSFHETKNYSCGQGGALCVNAPELVERAEILRDRGTDRSRFLRGEVSQYSWVDLGSSFGQSEILCAYLQAQLEQLDEISAMRARVAAWYRAHLEPLAARGLLQLPVEPPGCESNHHLFHVLLDTPANREDLLAFLAERGIQAARHYVPLHESDAGLRFGRATDLPVSERVSRCLLRLPIWNELAEHEVARVAQAVTDFFDSKSAD